MDLMLRMRKRNTGIDLADILDKKESYRRIRSFPGYICTSNGRIIRRLIDGSFKLVNANKRKKDGYCVVVLRRHKKPYIAYLHRIIATSFCFKDIHKDQVNHIDANKSNNHATNLEWVTAMENSKHAVTLGLSAMGNRIKTSKLTPSQVLEIRKSDDSHVSLSLKFNVHRRTIMMIRARSTWRHL